MPGSVRENNDFVLEFIEKQGQVRPIYTVLDVGAGRGTYSQILRLHVDIIDGIEVWQPYVDEFSLKDQYDVLHKRDARELLEFVDSDYDLIIFGDILEHMSREDSLKLWDDASKVARFGLISVPIIHYPQGAEFGNPYEIHVQDHLHPEELRKDYGPFVAEAVYEVTGTFIKEFK